mgnify:CR=1 FL=1
MKFVVFSMYEDFRYAQSAPRLGALDYISKISFEGDECDGYWNLWKENIGKYSQKETRNEDSDHQVKGWKKRG